MSLRRAFYRPGVLLAAGYLILLAAAAILAPWLCSASPWEMLARPLMPPLHDASHWLGTDMLGRDIATGLLYGARTSLTVGLLATLATLLPALLVGATAGYFGGWIDELLMRIAECFQIIPQLVLAVVLVALMEPSVGSVVLALALVAWPPVARLVRSEFMSLRQREFVQAALVLGQRPARIVFVQILPNALSPLLVSLTFILAAAILTEAALAFLGLGDPEAMSWGYMINASRNLLRDAPSMSLLPGVAILLTVLSVQRVGEALREAVQAPGNQGGRP
ncbi:ABC transporter permease [Pseudomonas nitroreducens]|uniref:ABC transporter permease n=1 Tax=Pseudomonas nitroreducens TaxID=46680 RepID=A0A5R9A4D8_PSENT|nr:ABC transporter permease [Pseudomonas nitroreducens]TLP73543.1 ABC transporter permease [Pseudomonas nitroreducens]